MQMQAGPALCTGGIGDCMGVQSAGGASFLYEWDCLKNFFPDWGHFLMLCLLKMKEKKKIQKWGDSWAGVMMP